MPNYTIKVGYSFRLPDGTLKTGGDQIELDEATAARHSEKLSLSPKADMASLRDLFVSLDGRPSVPMEIAALPCRPVDIILIGQSQFSRCNTEVRVTSAQVISQVLYVTFVPGSLGICTGLEAFCTVPGHQVYGPVTLTSATTLTMAAPGMADTVAETSGTFFLHYNALHAGASWAGHLNSRYGMGARIVANVSKHGDNVHETAARMGAILATLRAKRPHMAIVDPGWGNSINNGESWASLMPVAMSNLALISPQVQVMVVPTFIPIAPGEVSTPSQFDSFARMNLFIRTELPRYFPNVVVVDLTTPLLDYTRADGGSIPGIHSDALHLTPRGAALVAELGYGPMLDRYIPQIHIERGGVSHSWANTARQLYDGLVDATGYLPVVAGLTITGTLDNTMSFVKNGGGGTPVVAFSKSQRPNGLYKQTVAISSMTSSSGLTLSIKGAPGARLASRMVPGRTYRPVLRASILSVSGTVRAISFLGVITMTGVPGSSQCVIWAGRSQEGVVEALASVFPQTNPEPARDYYGADFKVPDSAVITDFEFSVFVRSGAANSAVTFEIEALTFLDVTDWMS